jgi:hypothetical protein
MKTINRIKANLIIGIIMFLTLFPFITNAQSNKCATMQNLNKSIAQNPGLKQRMLENEEATRNWIFKNSSSSKLGKGGIITIPTVVHVIMKDTSINITDNQIYSQINVLNKDFRLMNADTLSSQHPFWQFVSDTKIEFCLAKKDPNGNATTGITRTTTNVSEWGDSNSHNIKSTANGGHDNWNPNQYLNIYVVKLEGKTLGFATFPDELSTSPNLDGVVIRYEAFGTEGEAGTGDFKANNGGRTGTHEVGHWLNLRHIWGDTVCGNDFVDDTKPAEGSNFNCVTFPHRANNTCGADSNGEMYMNYMDYVDDSCMNMFTVGQNIRMQACLNGSRAGLLTSSGCSMPTSLNDISFANAVAVFPNPNNGQFTLSVDSKNINSVTATLIDILGATVKEFGIVSTGNSTITLSGVSSGVYYLKVSTPNNTTIKKIFLTK